MTFKANKKNSGFSLPEMLIGAGMIGALALAISSISKQSSKSVVKLNLSSDITLTVNEINSYLSDPKKCKLTFETTATPASIVSKINTDNSVTPPVYSIASEKFRIIGQGGDSGYGASKVKIISYELTQDGSDDIVLVKFQNKKSLKGNSGIDEVDRKISMYVELDGGGNVITCRALSSSSTLIWSRGTGDNIFFSGGNVGIETENPQAPLEVNGNILTKDITATTFTYSSDRRLKKNIKKINNPIATILSLRGVTFDWRDNDKHDFGFIAQEIREKIPEIVRDDYNRNILSVDYVKIIPILVEAIKKQQLEIKKLKNEISKL